MDHHTRVVLEFETCPVASCPLSVRSTGWHGACRGGKTDAAVEGGPWLVFVP